MTREVTFWIKFDHIKSIETSRKKNVKVTIHGDNDKLVKIFSQIDLESGFRVDLEEGEYAFSLEYEEVYFTENYVIDENSDEIEIFIS